MATGAGAPHRHVMTGTRWSSPEDSARSCTDHAQSQRVQTPDMGLAMFAISRPVALPQDMVRRVAPTGAGQTHIDCLQCRQSTGQAAIVASWHAGSQYSDRAYLSVEIHIVYQAEFEFNMPFSHGSFDHVEPDDLAAPDDREMLAPIRAH